MKPWYHSKTLWLNVIFLLLTWWIGQSSFYVNPQIVIVTLAILNIGLRFLTYEPLTMRE